MPKAQRQNFLQGAMILTAAMVVVKVIGAVYKIPLTNILGGTGMAYFMTAYSIFNIINLLSTAGFPVAVSKMVSENAARGQYRNVEKIRRLSVAFFLITGGVGSLTLVLGAKTFVGWVGNPNAYLAVLAIAPAVFFCCVMAVFRGYAQGMSNMLPTAVSQIVEAICKLIFGIFFAYLFIHLGLKDYEKTGAVFGQVVENADAAKLAVMPYGAAGAMLGVSVSTLAGAVYLLVTAKKSKLAQSRGPSGEKVDSASRLLKSLLLIALPVCAGSLMAQLTSVIDLVSIMKRLETAVALGGDTVRSLYSGLLPPGIASEDLPVYLYGSYSGLTISIFNLVPAITSAFGVSALPSIASNWALGRRAAAGENIRSVVKLAALLAIPAGLGIAALSHPILSLLYSNRIQEVAIAAPLLRIMGISAVFLAVNAPLTSIHQAIGKVHVPVLLMSVGAVLKLITNYILVAIPSVNIGGAPWGTLVCYGFIFIGSLISLKKHTGLDLKIKSTLIIPLICGILCGLAAHTSFGILSSRVDSRFGVLLSIGIGGAIYLVFILLLKVITREEALLLPNGKKIAKILEKLSFLG
ncbi:polysaccharide biosynthesis protein [Oscillospiraceae bacterium MB08-C2-2]|nr:polysaccharide biosynthesis protein [Oscillospiraceae bacterium MB08-C2-2]